MKGQQLQQNVCQHKDFYLLLFKHHLLFFFSYFQNKHCFYISVLLDHSLKGQADKYIAFLLTTILLIPWFGDVVEQRELSALSRPALIYKVTMSRAR